MSDSLKRSHSCAIAAVSFKLSLTLTMQAIALRLLKLFAANTLSK